MRACPLLPRLGLLVVASTALLVSLLVTLLGSTPASAADPMVAGCAVFPLDNVWNVRVDRAPVHPMSATWIASIGADENFHADFSSTDFNFGIPWIDVPGSQPLVDVVFGPEAGDESDPGPYPIPPNAPVEMGSDRHVLVVDRDACVLYELYDAVKQPDDSWTAYSGAIFPLTSNALRPDTFTSADAAGLPILPGLVRFAEADAGQIRHALRFTAPNTQDAHLWPARHDAGDPDLDLPPMGARFRLKASVSLAGLSPHAVAIGRAMQLYGIMLADNGSPWYVQGEPGEPGADWNDDVLHELDFLTGNDFEAVDVQPWMIDPDSARSDFVFGDGFDFGTTGDWSSSVP